MEGSGKMVVTAVGTNSQAGIIFALLGATADDPSANRNSNAAAETAQDNVNMNANPSEGGCQSQS